ncbi:MAG: DNA-processing protein DprA, partial [Puniceicoccales bacterium]
AVPGRIDQDSSAGCHQLIRDGAVLLTSVDDLINELAYGGVRQTELKLDATSAPVVDHEERKASALADLSDDERAVMTPLLEHDSLSRDALADQTGLPIAVVSATLLMLELKRRVGKRADGTYERRI